MNGRGPAGDPARRPSGSAGPTGQEDGEGPAPRDGPAGSGAGGPVPSEDLLRFWYRRHGDRVYRYARWRTGSRNEAEDVVADVFLEAWRSREAYDPDRGSVESWLLGIARNVIRRRRRRRAREGDVRAERDTEDLAWPGPGPEEETMRRDRVERMLRAVWRLPRRDRDLVALAYGAELSRRRIARLLGLTPEAVRVRLHRVLRRLRETLEAEE